MVADAAPTGEESAPRASFYGLTEIAGALDLDRQLVTAWRRRGSHALPEPDAELSSGPIWRGATIEPWIQTMRSRRPGGDVADLRPEAGLRLARRILRCAALVLETPVRSHLLTRALADVRAAVAEVTGTEGALADLARAAVVDLEPHLDARPSPGLTGALVAALPAVGALAGACGS